AVASGPAAATKAHTSDTCPPGTTNVDYCQVAPLECVNGKGVTQIGTDGDDLQVGTDCADVQRGGKGNDKQFGNGGADTQDGGAGKDKISGGAGNDTINAFDHTRDSINCGPGRDKATVDKVDLVRGCEKVIRK